MPGIIIAIFQATIQSFVDKGRGEAAKKLKYGDVMDQRVRGIIRQEIEEMKSRRNGFSRKDLLASIAFFREGFELLYEVFEETRSRSEYGADKEQAACAEPVSLTKAKKDLKLTEPASRQLMNAKRRFECVRHMATDAFLNEALTINDRILAMQYRVMATVLGTIDYPEHAVAPCKVLIEEINGLPEVQQIVKGLLKTGIRTVRDFFKKEERRKVISGVCLVNRIAYDITQVVSVKGPLPQLPMVDTGKEKVDLLRDRRVTEILCKQGMEKFSVSWILGHDGEEEHELNNPRDVVTNSSGQYIVANNDLTVEVFDNSGKFVQSVRLPPLIDDSGKELSIETWPVQLATDMDDNIYVLVKEESREDPCWIFSFHKTADQHHKFRVGTMGFDIDLCELSVSDSGKVMVLKRNEREEYGIVDVYETNGQFVCSFGKQILRSPCDITTVSDGRVMVVDQWAPTRVHIFSEEGDHLNKFYLHLQSSLYSPKIAFHRESQQVVVVGGGESLSDTLYIGIYTKDGEFLRSTLIHMGGSIFSLNGIAVTTEGRIAVVTCFPGSTSKVFII